MDKPNSAPQSALSKHPSRIPGETTGEKTTISMFNILPGFQKTPAGLERRILKWLPRITWVGTLLFGAL